MYSASTRSITVIVQPSYLEEESTPADNQFRWAYHVRIENQSKATIKLVSRYWRITDAMGRVQEVRGSGVVGEQPAEALDRGRQVRLGVAQHLLDLGKPPRIEGRAGDADHAAGRDQR